jgi:8-oxo-dGTP pyrophosphatase MutT (NUDIX family)
MDTSEIETRLNARQRIAIPDGDRPRAAVLVPLYGPGPDFRLLYTLRTHKVEHHKGEISFPGGAKDPDDESVRHTALRESMEEIGTSLDNVDLLGLLDDIVTTSNFVVTAIVGRIRPYPYEFSMHEAEVAQLLEVPLSHLREPANQLTGVGPRGGPAYAFESSVIWGATARITAGFLAILGDG